MNDVNEDYDAQMAELLQEAINEVVMEEAMKTESYYDSNEFNGIGGFEDESNFYIEQDVSDIIEEAKRERDMRSDGLIKPEKGIRKFATVPVTAIIDYYNKYGVDIMDAETSRDQWEMAKFRMWIQNEHPQFMVREVGKTKFHTLK